MSEYRGYGFFRTRNSNEIRDFLRMSGLIHPARLGALIVLLTFGGYHLFAQAASNPSRVVNSRSGDAKSGGKIFVAQRCGVCHGVKGEGASQPGIGIAGPRISPPPESLSAFAAFVRAPRPPMPAYSTAKVSDVELADLYAFLKSIGSFQGNSASAGAPPAGNAQDGKRIYTGDGCYECHGRHAEGSIATGPRLTPPPLDFEAFVSYVRHPMGSMPPYTGKVISDLELADIFAFLRSLPPPPKVETIPLLKLK